MADCERTRWQWSLVINSLRISVGGFRLFSIAFILKMCGCALTLYFGLWSLLVVIGNALCIHPHASFRECGLHSNAIASKMVKQFRLHKMVVICHLFCMQWHIPMFWWSSFFRPLVHNTDSYIDTFFYSFELRALGSCLCFTFLSDVALSNFSFQIFFVPFYSLCSLSVCKFWLLWMFCSI